MGHATTKSVATMMAISAILTYPSCSGIPEGGADDNDGHLIVNDSASSVKGHLLVCISDDAYNDNFNIEGVSLEPLVPGLAETPSQWFLATFSTEYPVQEVARNIASCEGVISIQYDKILQRVPVGEVTPADPFAMTKAEEDWPFDDPRLAEQWHLINTGNTSICKTAVEGADVGVKDAWRLTAGDPSVVVAIVDEAIMYTHPDLEANMWVNEAELNGVEGRDDDGNGYVDDIHGYNFASDTPELCWSHKEDFGHGTHVAGVVAAVNNNAEGVCGVAGGSGKGDGVRLMSCQVFDGELSSSASLARALRYAADNGASIAQCSLGYESGEFKDADDFKRKCAAEYAGISYFLDKAHNNSSSLDGNIIIFSAGNEGRSPAGFPGGLEDVICVTSFGPGFQPAGYTNFGPGCNIAAPGGDFYVGRAGSNSKCQVLSTVFDSAGNASYAWMEGTSMACPHVSGVAALGLSYAAELGKHFSREEFVSMLLTSVVGIDKYFVGTKPRDGVSDMTLDQYEGQMGTGAVNAWKLLMQIEGTPSVQVVLGGDTVNAAYIFGDPCGVLTDYKVTMDQRYRTSLGITSDISISGDGVISIECTKVGSGKLTVSAMSSGTPLSKEISIIARPAKSNYGGWL